MENLFGPLKSVLVTALCAVLAFFAPIANLIFSVFLIFMLNCIAGIVADLVVDKHPFDLRKFFHCLFETMVFYVIIMAVYAIGDKLLNLEGAVQCSTVIVYAILYFYGTNIIRNTIKLFPDSRTLKFIYYILSFEIIKKLPYLARFKESEKEVDKQLEEDIKTNSEKTPTLGDTCKSKVCAYHPCSISTDKYCPMYTRVEREL